MIKFLNCYNIQSELRLRFAVADAPLVKFGGDARWRRCTAVIAVRPRELIGWWEDDRGHSPGMVVGARVKRIVAAMWPTQGATRPRRRRATSH
jgi:hypothetical protein